MSALIVAAAILVFSVAEMRAPIDPFRLDRAPPPPPDNVAAQAPAQTERICMAAHHLIARVH